MALFNSMTKRRTISLTMLLYIARQNLLSKKLRTSLTLSGVIIGIGAIFFLLSFGLGLQKIVTDEIVGNQSIKSIDVSSPNSALLLLNQDSLNKFVELPNVDAAGGSFLLPGVVQVKGSEVDAVTYGVDQQYQSISNFTASIGRLLLDEDNRQVVVNTSLLETIGLSNDEFVLGTILTLQIPFKTALGPQEIDEEFEIVGIINSGAGSEVLIPAHVLQAAGADTFSQVKIIVNNNDNVGGIRSQVEALGFETVSPIDTIEQINQIFRYFNIILGGFGAIGMIVAILGMFNTLTISLLERTKEIGLMIALGAKSRDMKQLFVLEALILSISGAVIGIILALITGGVFNTLTNQYAKARGVTDSFNLFSTPWWLTTGVIVFMASIGLLVVYFPARRAEHISPIEALRRE